MQPKKDLQASSSDQNGEITIDKVGITGIKKRIQVNWDEFHQYWVAPKISALIRLPKHQRGIHMSRSAETIEDSINMTVFKPVHSLEELAKRILDHLLDSHTYSDHAEVSMAGDLIIQVKNGEDRQGQKPFEITVDANADRINGNGRRYYGKVGLAAWGMTCCPCAQEMNIEYIESLVSQRKDLNITHEDLEKLIKIIPVASHNQRAQARIQIGFNNLDKEVLNVLDLIEVMESSMSGRIQAVLKRPDEAELVRIAHFDPVFVEDAVRRMALKLLDSQFIHISNETPVQISIESYESIHVHNAYAEINSTFGELRTNLKKP